MLTLKSILAKSTKWLWLVLTPLGVWGAFAFAAVDAALIPMPLDAVIAAYVYKDPHRFLIYVALASAGSAIGSLLIYAIGYAGGEVFLRKKLSPERFEKIHASFDRHEFWTVMFPAMLPPPTPFKAIVLAAAAFEMRLSRFLLAIFAGRFLRFLLLAILTIKFGPQFVQLAGAVFSRHLTLILVMVSSLALIAWLLSRRQKQADASS